MSTTVIRPALPTDAAAIDAAGYQGALHHHWAEPSLFAQPKERSHEWSESALAQSPESVCLVAELQGQVVGYVHALLVHERRPMFLPHRYGRIEAVSVLPQFQCRGIGTALLEGAEQWLARRGCKVARLSVFASNRTASAMHVARGYTPLVTYMQRNIDDAA